MRTKLISPSPHIHGKESTPRIMRDVIIALIPTVLVACYFSGLKAVEIMAISVVGCLLCEYLITRFLMHKPSTLGDLSAVVTGLLLALNLPASAPWWMVLIGCVVAIGIAKMTFGGLGNNLFNPALVARVFLLVSFPVQMTNWRVGNSIFRPDALEFPTGAADAFSGATPLGVIKEGLANGETMQTLMQQYDFTRWEVLFGNIGGSMGEASAVAILLGLVYLLVRKVIRPHIPVSILLTVFVFAGILWKVNPNQYADPLFHLLTGGLLLGAVFMATDYVTSPMTGKGMVIYGVGIGVITLLIRNFGAYPEGVSFAILFMNACVPLLNKYCKPKVYAPAQKKEVSRG